ncbi:FAD:protein FMN transferase [Dermatophilaceae bacterium Soc4.6]
MSGEAYATYEFDAIGCHHRLLATCPDALAEAAEQATRLVAALDLAASRFRPDSEVSRIAASAPGPGATTVTHPVSALLTSCLAAALHAARITDGLVDPTVGAALVASGYDDDLEVVRRRAVDSAVAGRPDAILHLVGSVPTRPTWRDLVLDEATGQVTVPAGTLIDLGATAKAHAADLLATSLAAQLPGGFLVNLGGDIAVAGELPDGGWPVGVQDAEGAVQQAVTTTGQALATSSTRLRTWLVDGVERHHVIDPRTGATAPTTWAQATCAATSCLEANAASTAAIVLGEAAPAWLEGHGIPARLVGLDGRVVTTPGWPAADADDAGGAANGSSPRSSRGGPGARSVWGE